MPNNYDPAFDIIDAAIYVPHVTDPIRSVTNAEKASRVDTCPLAWFARNKQYGAMSFTLADGTRYEYARRKTWV